MIWFRYVLRRMPRYCFDRIVDVRRIVASELGIIVPGVRLRDNFELPAHTYAIAVRGEVVARGEMHLEMLLAVAAPEVLELFEGVATVDPIYGLAARRIAVSIRDEAMHAGALVFDPITIIGSHLAEVIRAYATRLLGRQELQTLLDHLRVRVPMVIKDIQHERLGTNVVLRLLHALLEERVWPRDVIGVLESIIDLHTSGNDERAMVTSAASKTRPLATTSSRRTDASSAFA